MKRYIFGIIAFAAFLSSCNNDIIFTDQRTLPETGWNKDSVLTFKVQITDTAALYNLMLDVRHTTGYPYQNLWLFANYTRPDKSLKRDSVNYFLADDAGKWLGKGFGGMRQMNAFITPNVKFTQKGEYVFTIQHAMRDTTLRGVRNIELEITKK